MLNAANWTARLTELAAEARVPGAALGIWDGSQEILAASGELSAATKVCVTADSLFQVGSITKIWTATMIMQLVDEGQLSLDTTVAEVMPGVRLGAGDLGGLVTVRHLLTHTSGIDGDVFTDTGRGDDCVERYVGLLAETPSVFAPGAAYSYCNSGFVVLGRIIEMLDGQSWDESLRERLVGPLGITRTVTLPEEAILHRAAVGHRRGGAPVRRVEPAARRRPGRADHRRRRRPARLRPPAPRWRRHGRGQAGRERGVGSGHATGGRGDSRVLRAGLGRRPGLAAEPVGRPHDHRARRRHHRPVRLPEDRPGGGGGRLPADQRHRVRDPVPPGVQRGLRSPDRRDAAGTAAPGGAAGPPADAAIADLGRHAGHYERVSRQFDVSVRDGQLRMVLTMTGNLAALTASEPEDLLLHPADASGDRFVLRSRDDEPWIPLSFGRLGDGTPYIYLGGRVTLRTG